MAEAPPAPAASSAKTVKKKSGETKKPGASLSDLILKAVSESKERRGASLPAIKKYLASNNYDIEKNKSRIRTSVKALVDNGSLQQTTGSGASGSFKIGKTESTTKVKKAAPKVKKPAAKKAAAKKPVAKKPVAKKTKKVAAKKTIVKKSPKKAVASKRNSPIKKSAKKTAKSLPKSPKRVKPAKKTMKPKTKPKKTVPKKTAPKKK